MVYTPTMSSHLIVPTVIENTPQGSRASDIYSRLLEDRIVFLGGAIDDTSANLVVAQLLFLASKDTKKEISLYINSPGGDVTATLAILDTMNHVNPDVRTICIGLAASGGAIVLSAGTKGKRFALTNSEIMIHQPHGGVKGQETDITIASKRFAETRASLDRILAKNCGKSMSDIKKHTERDYYMGAKAAKAFGIIDNIIK